MCSRWFYRCVDCFAVVAAEEELKRAVYPPAPAATCAACGGSMECMGKVDRDRLTRTDTLCACDDRCTSATGPNCNCKCGGVNHGSNRTVQVVRDLGPVPVLKVPYTPALRVVAEEWRAALAPVLAERDAIGERRQAGWISRPAFDRWRWLCEVVAKARAARSHKARMRLLESVRAQVAA